MDLNKYLTEDKKDDKGRLGFKSPWMDYDCYNKGLSYLALLSGTGQKQEFKVGDCILVNFINGFPDRPIIIDKL